jgi:predicted small lipoprotein YifL
MGVGVSRKSERALVRFAVAGALVAALGLTACGRKAGLDPPPAAAAVPTAEGVAPAPDMLGADSEGRPVAPATSQRKHFFLDWLLD